MGGHLVVVGVSHRAAPLAIRERVVLHGTALDRAYGRLREVATEGLILSTCARTEVVALVPRACDRGALVTVLRGPDPVAPGLLQPVLHRYAGPAASRYLGRIAAGVESPIPGEPEILGQLRDARDRALREGTLGLILERLIGAALRAGRRARAETAIGRGRVSLIGAAVSRADGALGGLAGRPALVVGAGRVGARAAQVLARRGARVVVVNRTEEKAVSLAAAVGGHARAWSDLAATISEADLVLAATAAGCHVIGVDLVARAASGRAGPLVLVDLAAPRDIAPEAGALPGVVLFDLDTVRAAGERAAKGRRAAREAAVTIVDREIEQFERWRRRHAIAPVVRALVARGSTIRESELERAFGPAGTADSDRIRRLASRIVNRLLDAPLRRLATEPDGAALAASAARLFGLEPVGRAH